MARWTLALLLPAAGFFLLLARPDWDVHWEHHRAHFWLVFSVAVVNAALGLVMSEAARRRGDARVFFVALAFLASGGFLALHALATHRASCSRGRTRASWSQLRSASSSVPALPRCRA